MEAFRRLKMSKCLKSQSEFWNYVFQSHSKVINPVLSYTFFTRNALSLNTHPKTAKLMGHTEPELFSAILWYKSYANFKCSYLELLFIPQTLQSVLSVGAERNVRPDFNFLADTVLHVLSEGLSLFSFQTIQERPILNDKLQALFQNVPPDQFPVLSPVLDRKTRPWNRNRQITTKKESFRKNDKDKIEELADKGIKNTRKHWI